MFTDPSVLQSIKTTIRTELDEAEIDAKYTDSYLVGDVVPKAMSTVLENLNHDRKNKIRLRYEFTSTKDQEYYRLPANVGQVVQLMVMKDSGSSLSPNAVVHYISHRHPLNRFGPGYLLEGNELRLLPAPTGAFNYALEYLPGGGFMPHYSTGGDLSSGLDEITLDTTPDLGVLDRREGAFNGQMVRVIPSAGPVEEAVILSHTWDGSNWKVKLRRPLGNVSAGTVTYEIVDHPTLSLTDSVCWASILRIAASRRVSRETQRKFIQMYLQALKTEGDRVASMDLRANAFGTDTMYAEMNGPPFIPRGT